MKNGYMTNGARSFFLNTLLLGCLFLGLFTSAQLFGQCEEAGYYLTSSFIAPSCPTDSSGTATVASTGCDCMFSGCTYEWSSGQTFHTAYDLPAGTYTVVVTHPNGCVLETEVVVEAPESFVEDFVVENIACKGEESGRIMVVVPDSIANQVTYEWSTGANTAQVDNLGVGEYSVMVADFGGCSVEKSFVIEEPTETLSVSWDASPACEGAENGLANILPEGGQPPYYCKWDNGDFETNNMEMQLGGGSHQVIVKDANDCEVTIDLNIEEISISAPSVTAGYFSICKGDVTSLSAFTDDGGYVYEWSPANGISNPYSNVVLVSPEETTTYTVEVTNSEGCKSDASLTVFVNECDVQDTSDVSTNVEEVIAEEFQAYPNPTKDVLYFLYPTNQTATINLYTTQGRLVQSITTQENSLSLKELNNGVYFVEYINANKRTIQKILKQ